MTPFDEGRDAAIRGESKRSCPHPESTEEWEAWQEGHSSITHPDGEDEDDA